jgi:NADH-quinone oxidoreductase subunit M
MALAEAAVLGAFMAQDLALFVLFFDLMLVPFLFLMLGWGGSERRAATLKMIIYTLVGSLLMLAAAVATAVLGSQETGNGLTFVLSDLADISLPESTQRWLFAGFALAFLIKMPAFPFQGWMPEAYGQMPLPALAVFSGALSKVAAYGFLRIVFPLVPDAAVDFQLVILLIGLAGILYGSAMAFTQTSLRMVLGYSSIAQLGFITLGIFSFRDEGVQGAILQSVNHGLVVAPLFFIIALVAERARGSEDLREIGGLAFRGPVFATLFLIVALATLAIPGSANFAGEFLILLGLFNSKLAIAVIAFTGVAMASVYMLRAYIGTMHSRAGRSVGETRDLGWRDSLVLVPLVLCILAFALYPQAALQDGEQAAKGIAPHGEQVAIR